MNLCIFYGRLARDPDLRYVGAKNTAVVNLTLAVAGREYVNKDGEKQYPTEFVNFEAWEKGAEYIAENFSKGDKMVVQSSFKNEKWEDSEGNTRYGYRFRINSFENPGFSTKQRTENDSVGEDVSEEVAVAAGEDEIPF